MAQFLLLLTWHRIQLQSVDRNCFWSAMQFQAFACSLHDSCITPCYRVVVVRQPVGPNMYTFPLWRADLLSMCLFF